MKIESTSVKRPLKRALRPAKRTWLKLRTRLKMGKLHEYVGESERIAGWARGAEANELALTARSLPGAPVIMEVGTFLGSSAVLLAGARKIAGAGVVHCVDPFDSSGDAHSVPFYKEITDQIPTSMRGQFDENMRAAGVSDWVVVHEGTSEAIVSTWSEPIDLLFLDGDQSPAGARSAYESWVKFLKPGGVIAIHNSADRAYSDDHDGSRRVVVESIVPPQFVDIRCVGTTTFATRVI